MIKALKRLMMFFIIFVVVSVIFYFAGIPIVSKVNEDKNKTRIKEFLENDCTSYYDGCNDCSLDSDGSTTCTLRWCTRNGKAKCYIYGKPR